MKFTVAQGFDPDAAAALVDETLTVLEHPQFAAAFMASSRAEVAFQAALPALGAGAQVNGRVDRLAVTEEEVLILDFKTNRPPPAHEDDVSAIYLAQMALYRAAAAQIFPDKRIICGLIWTDGPFLMRLSDGLLDRQMALIRRRLDPEGGHS
jgi:ATP-dependent helicase/nuclease subunit A